MSQDTLYSPLYIQDQRSLDNHRIVVRGPTGRNARWVWTLLQDQPVTVYPVQFSGSPMILAIDRPSVSELTSDEMFGFDAATSICPRLRRSQQYSTVVLKSEAGVNFVGAVVVPEQPDVRVSLVRATVHLNLPATTDRLFQYEIETFADTDHVVWRYQGDAVGYLIIHSSMLLKQGPKSVDAVLVYKSGDAPAQKLQLFGTIPIRPDTEGDLSYAEVPVGEAEVIPASLR